MLRPSRHRLRWLAAVAWTTAGVGAVVIAAPASAGSFKVNPVQVVLAADAQVARLTIANSDSALVSVRATAMAWSQANGMDVYSPTTNVIVSPPIFTIPAGKTQLVRVGLKARTAAPAYRLIFTEIPRDRPAEGQIQVNLRLNLPLYLLPPGGGSSVVEWRAWTDRSGAMIVEGSNRGTRHAQVVGIAAIQGDKREPLSAQMGVILPGSMRRWSVGKHPSLGVGHPIDLIVRSPSGETRARVALEQR